MNLSPHTPALAVHYFFEICPVETTNLDNPSFCEQVLYALAEAAGVTPLQCVSNKFVPQGCSVVLLLSESHASIHTWPEHQMALIDLFSCQQKTSLSPLLTTLQNFFPSAVITSAFYPRGGQNTDILSLHKNKC